jgi:hydroxyacylglutathione hydrolase
MEILTFECGPLYTNAYVVGNPESGKAVLIDCPPDTLRTLRADNVFQRYEFTHLLITHGHWDHTGGAKEFKAATGAQLLVHPNDAPGLADPGLLIGHPVPGVEGCEPDELLEENQIIDKNGLRFTTLFTPGHTAGHVTFYLESEKALFAGDVLFLGSIGRTDLPGGDYDALMESIRLQLLPLPDDTRVYPGHGPATTLGAESKTNPFILDYLSHFT